MSKNKLGLGISALLSQNNFSEAALEEVLTQDSTTNNDRLVNIDIELIQANKAQPRKLFDKQALEELAQSIKNHGVLQPLLVYKEASKYIIIAGERRFRAAKLAKLDSVPCIVLKSSELERIELAIVENLQREDLNPLELAESLIILNQQFDLSVAEIANKIGKAEITVINILRLNKLDDRVKLFLRNKKISEGHARILLGLEPDEQYNLAKQIINDKLSVRETEGSVHLIKLNKRIDERDNESDKDSIELKVKLPTNLSKIKDKYPFIREIKYLKNSRSTRVEFVFKDKEDYNTFIDLMSNI